MSSKTIISKILIALLLAAGLSLVSSTCMAAVYYVDKNHSSASDSNPGSESSPWKTIQKGANVAVAGDTVYVKDGIYNEQVSVKNSGTSGKPIKIAAYPGDQPIIDGTGVTLSSYKGLLQSESKNFITFDGFHVRNSAQVLVRATYGEGIIVKNCLIHTNFASGRDGVFFTNVTNSYFENNEVYDAQWNGINVTSSTNTTVRNNYVHDNPLHAAINIFPRTSAKQTLFSGNNIIGNRVTSAGPGAAIYTRYQTNNIIANNTVYDHSGVGIKLDVDRCESGIDPCQFVHRSDTKIVNNTIVGNAREAIIIENATHTTIKNNIIASNGATINIASKANTGHVIDYNMYSGTTYSGKGSNGFTAAPQFEDEPKNNYNLTESSPAIDSGADLSDTLITNDIEGAPRPQGNGFDIGAYEFQVSKRPSPPKNLSISQ